MEAIGRESLLGDVTRNELKQLQQVFGLRNEDVAPIVEKSLKSLQTSLAPQQSTNDHEVVSPPADLGMVVPQPQTEAETPAALNPEFIEHCRRELARFIGPVAGFILKDTLAQYPHISRQQLVESLTVEITNPQKAQEFKQHLL